MSEPLAKLVCRARSCYCSRQAQGARGVKCPGGNTLCGRDCYRERGAYGRGVFQRRFIATPAHELGAAVIKAALTRAKAEAGEVDEVILGQVLTANQGQNRPVRRRSRRACRKIEAFGLNQVCGSGCARLRSNATDRQWEPKSSSPAAKRACRCRSMAPICAAAPRWRSQIRRSMIRDGLTDVFNGYHMGQTPKMLRRNGS